MICEGCTQNTGRRRRRCLLQRAHDAAAAGNEGARLAVKGAAAIGARVSVWWPLDESSYEGIVSIPLGKPRGVE